MPSQRHLPSLSVARILLFELVFLTPLFFYAWSTTFLMAKTTFAELSCLVLLCAMMMLWVRGRLVLTGGEGASRFVDVCVVLLGGYLVLSALWSGSLYLSFVELGVWGVFVLVYTAVRFTITTRHWMRILLIGLAISALIAAAYTVLQFYGVELPIWQRLTGRMRLFSTFGNPNYLAGYLVSAILLTTVLFLTSRRYLWLAAIGIQYAALILTESRGAWGALFVSVCFIVVLMLKYNREFLQRHRQQLALLAGVLAAITILFMLPGGLGQSKIDVRERVGSVVQGVSASKQRVLIWQSSRELILERPFLGWGIGTYGMHYADGQKKVLSRPENEAFIGRANRSINAHNDFLHMWAETGIIGLALFGLLIAGMYWTVFRMLRSRRRAQDHDTRVYVIFLGGAMTSFLVHAMVSFPFHILQNGMVWWLLLGLLQGVASGNLGVSVAESPPIGTTEGKEHGKCRCAKSLFRWLLLAAVIAGTLYLGVWRVRIFSSDLHAKSAQSHLEAGALSEAQKELERALELNPHNFEAWAHLSRLYISTGEFDRVFEAASRARPGYDVPNLGNRVAFAHLQQGNVEEARRALAENARRYPNFGATYMNWGNLNYREARTMIREHQLNKAQQALDEAFTCYCQAKILNRREYPIPRALSIGYLELLSAVSTPPMTAEDAMVVRGVHSPFRFHSLIPRVELAPVVCRESVVTWCGALLFVGGADTADKESLGVKLSIENEAGILYSSNAELTGNDRGNLRVVELYPGISLVPGEYFLKVVVQDGEDVIAEASTRFACRAG